jgi:hypothetical protein
VRPQGIVIGVPKKKWKDLSPRTRRFIVLTGAIDGSLKITALFDLARRPAEEIRGPKLAWAAAITTLNSFGVVPILYLTRGRRAGVRAPSTR